MLLGAAALGLLLGNCSAWRGNSAAAQGKGEAALRSGDYAAARESFEAAVKARPDLEDSRFGLLQTLLETGEYQAARKNADTFLAARENSGAIHLQGGKAAALCGDYPAAEKHLRRSLALGGSTRMDALRELALLLEATGRAQESDRLWDQAIGEHSGGRVKGSRQLGAAAVAHWRRGNTEFAKDLFLDATEAKSGQEIAIEALSDFGYLFLDKYNVKEALGVFRDCLAINKKYAPALLGIAFAKQYESSAEVETWANSALGVNPNFVPAINLIAELKMQHEAYDDAMSDIRRSLSINPADLETLSLQAVWHYLRADAAGFAAAEQKVLKINPRYGRLYHTLAENVAMRRKYQEAVEFSRKALELDPLLWAAEVSLGMNLMRVGDLEQGRKAIERGFEGDGYNIWAYNTLGLLDQMEKFVSSKSENFVYRISPEDQSSLYPYVSKLAEEVYANLSRRYRFTPNGPIQIEVFPDHEGFAVRTLGVPGLGALGVCFGKVIALDSPRARKPGSFNWGSTLWHEFAHVVTLQMTNHNIPRWYSEGLSVFEERKARPGWGDDLNPSIVKAYKEGKLLKVSELNEGMMRPKVPEQIAFSYYQASLVCELIEQKFGFDKIRETLELFARNKSTEEVFRQTLGWDTATLDKEYARYLDEHMSKIAARLDFKRMESHSGNPDKNALSAVLQRDPDDFFANLQMALLLRKEKANDAAEGHFKKARQLFPAYTEAGNPYEELAELYEEQKRKDEALAEYLAWSRYDENALTPLMRAADIYRERKDWTSVARVLELAMYIHPYDPKAHTLLAEAAEQSGSWNSAAAAYQVLLSLDTSDPAEAHYNLARVLTGAGKKQEARREVLKALEIAPSFEKAQQLLLKLSGGGTP